MQNGVATQENSLAVSFKTKHAMPYNPATAPSGIYPRKMKTYVAIQACLLMFIAYINMEKTDSWINDGI